MLSGFVKKVCKKKNMEAKILNIEDEKTLKNSLEELNKYNGREEG